MNPSSNSTDSSDSHTQKKPCVTSTGPENITGATLAAAGTLLLILTTMYKCRQPISNLGGSLGNFLSNLRGSNNIPTETRALTSSNMEDYGITSNAGANIGSSSSAAGLQNEL